MSILSFTPKKRGSKRSRRSSARADTWKSSPEKYKGKKKPQRGKPGIGLIQTDHEFTDVRAHTSNNPIYCKEIKYTRKTLGDDWTAGDVKRTVISESVYKAQIDANAIEGIEKYGNRVRIIQTEDGAVRKEVLWGNGLVKIVTEYMTKDNENIRSFSKK